MKYIADFSDWQAGIDFHEIARKFDGVIVKIAEGTTAQDCFRDFIHEAESFDLPWGVYCYTRAGSTEESREEAELVMRLLAGEEMPALGIWYDIESPQIVGENGSMPVPPEDITAMASAFISKCNEEGYSAGIYAPLWVLRDRLRPTDLAGYVHYWISAPGRSACPEISGITNVAGWQYRVDDYPIGSHMIDANEWYK